jgi:REP element-mobilizing transposase RayT
MDNVCNKKEVFSRKSPRAHFGHYCEGDYFITICTQDKAHYFGSIINGEMHLSEMGECCRQQLEELSLHYPYAEVLLYTVMPNHVHLLLRITPRNDGADNTQRSSLGIVIGGFKREVKLFAKRHCLKFAWHNRYHDHIIRGALDGNNIANYIRTNVERWEQDCFNKMNS